MLRLTNAFKGQAVLSLRTGGQIALIDEPIVNPNNLKLEGWHTINTNQKEPLILPSAEVRDIIARGVVVNDHEALTEPKDLVRLKEVLEINFSILGKLVATESGRKLGKVSDYSVDDSSFYVQKLYVSPSLMKGFSTKQTVVGRGSITEVTDKKIIVSDSTVKVTSRDQVLAQA